MLSSTPLVLSVAAHFAVAGLALHHLHASAHAAPNALERTSYEIQVEEPLAEAPVEPVQAPATHTDIARDLPAKSVIHAPSPQASGDDRETTEAPAPIEPEPVAAPVATPHFAMTVAASTNAPVITPTGSGPAAPGPAAGSPVGLGTAGASGPIAEAAVDSPARLRLGAAPAYTAAALSAGVEADVPLEIVVSEAGSVTSARSAAHVGYGLDAAAIQSVLSYRFAPAIRAGKAVAVRMRWLMRFQIR